MVYTLLSGPVVYTPRFPREMAYTIASLGRMQKGSYSAKGRERAFQSSFT